MTNLIGTNLLGQFRVDDFIAAGGMGAVYKVWDIRRNVSLAMKVLHADLADDPSIFKRFEREARALQKLAHPNIVPFYGLYKTDDFAFLLEQYVDGPTLKQVLEQQNGKPLTLQQTLIYLKALSAALGYAHANGVVHCDVKPGNVMIDRGGSIYLTDFGVARHIESATPLLRFAGTPAFMAPEQIRGDPVGAATDIYSLGVVLYEMATGIRPFLGTEEGTEKVGTTTSERIRYAHLQLSPINPRQANSTIPQALAEVILKALEKDPRKRYNSARELYEAACVAANADPQAVPNRIDIAGTSLGTSFPAHAREASSTASPLPRRMILTVILDAFRQLFRQPKMVAEIQEDMTEDEPPIGPASIELSSPFPSAYLLEISGPNRGMQHVLTAHDFVIGRVSTADLVVQDSTVSRQHCRISTSDGSVFLRDLSSSGGTYVNGRRIHATKLADGDIINIGRNTKLLFITSIQQYRFRQLWDEAISNLQLDAEDNEFRHTVKEIISEFCSSIQLSLLDSAQQFQYRDFIVYYADTTPAFTNTLLPIPLPIIVAKRVELSQSDAEDLKHIITNGQAINRRVAILVLFGSGEQIERSKRFLIDRLQSNYACDVVLLLLNDLIEITSSRDPHGALRRLFLSQLNLAAISPFTIAGPTPEHVFVGREPQMREIVEHAAVSSFVLIGGRRFGKTSILHRLNYDRLPKAGFHPYYQDCSTATNKANFLQATSRAWTLQSADSALAFPTIPSSFTELFDRLSPNTYIVILLDEADKLILADRNDGYPLFTEFRALAQAGRCKFVMAGERVIREAVRDANGPLFNFANEMLIGRLDFMAVEELVTQPMRQLEIELVDEIAIVRKIYDFTSGHPNVTQRLCQRLIIRLNERQDRRIEVDDVEDIIADPDFVRRDFLGTFWERASVLEKLTTLVILKDSMANTLIDIRTKLAREGIEVDLNSVDEALERLVDLRNILKRTLVGYEFAVPAFPQVVAKLQRLDDLIALNSEIYHTKGDVILREHHIPEE